MAKFKIRKILIALLGGVGFVALATVTLKDMPKEDSWFALDTGFHFLGGVFAAWFASLFTNRQLRVFIGVVLIGLLWELAEHLSTVYGQTYWPVIYVYYHSGSLVDTIHDLIADALGGIIFILIYYRYEK